MLANGFGEHNIQGIGDKHIPLIHNVMATDLFVGGLRPRHGPAAGPVQHRPSVGDYLVRRRGVPEETVTSALGPRPLVASATCWPRSRSAKQPAARPGRRDRDGRHRRRRAVREASSSGSSPGTSRAGSTPWRPARRSGRPGWARSTRPRPRATRADRDRIFDLGYYTWVEQQGVSHRGVRGEARPGVLDRHPRDRRLAGTS